MQFDGCGTSSEDRILMVGATNRYNITDVWPHEIDEAARRRFRKKLYIPLPDNPARLRIIQNLLSKHPHTLTAPQLDQVVVLTDGYSGSDMDGLIREAALGPIRDIVDIETCSVDAVRGIFMLDFENALTQVRASVSDKDLKLYLDFDKEYGSMH